MPLISFYGFIFLYRYTFRADSRLAPSQWETSLQSNAVSHWLCASLESALHLYVHLDRVVDTRRACPASVSGYRMPWSRVDKDERLDHRIHWDSIDKYRKYVTHTRPLRKISDSQSLDISSNYLYILISLKSLYVLWNTLYLRFTHLLINID